jgi:hypothetical protein
MPICQATRTLNGEIMIIDKRAIDIAAPPATVFTHIDAMPNKFPVYRLFETPVFFFIRMALVDGPAAAIRAIREKHTASFSGHLDPGDTLGPFTLVEKQAPFTYMFDLNSLFFHCRTGYELEQIPAGTRLHFDTISADPGLLKQVWWFCILPVHILFANKVLGVIKRQVEDEVSGGHG